MTRAGRQDDSAPTGPTGPAGPQGSTGLQGDPGPDGVQGPAGDLGAAGSKVAGVCPPGAHVVGVDHENEVFCSAAAGSNFVDAGGNESSLVLDVKGNPMIAYSGFGGDLGYVHCGNPNCSYGNTYHTLDSAGTVGGYPSLALDTSGNPVISYYDATNARLKLATCTGPDCAGWSTGVVDGFSQGHTSMVLDAFGYPVISHYTGDLMLAHCGTADCSSGNTLVTVDGTATVGWYNSIALDGSGFPVISYYDFTNGDLKLVHCGDADCSSGNTLAAVDSAGDVGSDTSLVLDASGYPVISYIDVDNQDLKLVHCGSSDCTSGNTVTTVDTTGTWASFTSLVLDAAGNPVIAYRASTVLRLAVCGNPTCSSGNRFIDVASGYSHPSLLLDTVGNAVVSHYRYGIYDDLELARASL